MSIEVSNLVHEYIQVRSERLHHDQESRKLMVLEEQLKYEITRAHKNGTLQVPDDVNFQYEEKSVPFVEDWPAFINWIIENDAPDVLQKRITESAVWARMEAGVDLPGVIVILKPVITALPKV